MTLHGLKDIATALFIVVGTLGAIMLLGAPSNAWEVLVGIVLFVLLTIVAMRRLR